ncbi:MAG TPA: hypothetical protein VGL75_04435 [Acidothermaceae bacterium]|jgi:hypothetical protein
MKLTASNILAFTVGLVALVGALVLTGVHTAVPAYVWAIALAGITAGAGLSVPGNGAPTATLGDLADVLPTLISRLNTSLPGAVKVEDVAAEILRQVATTTAAPVTPLIGTAVSPSAAAVAASVAPFVPTVTPSSS